MSSTGKCKTMGDWLVTFVMIFMWGHGFITAWAFSHENDPFWRGWLDVTTLRILWRKA
jgi:hypothetical protein